MADTPLDQQLTSTTSSTGTPSMSREIPMEATRLNLASPPAGDTTPPMDLSFIDPNNPLSILAFAAGFRSWTTSSMAVSPALSQVFSSCSSPSGSESIQYCPPNAACVCKSPPVWDREQGPNQGITGDETEEEEEEEEEWARAEKHNLRLLLAAARKIGERIVVAKAAELLERVVSRACTTWDSVSSGVGAGDAGAGTVGSGGKRKRTKSRKLQEQEQEEGESDEHISERRKRSDSYSCSCSPSVPAILAALKACASVTEQTSLAEMVAQAKQTGMGVDSVLWEAAAVVWKKKNDEKERTEGEGNPRKRRRRIS